MSTERERLKNPAAVDFDGKIHHTIQMEKQLRDHLLALASQYVAFTGCGFSTLARRCRNDSGFFDRLQQIDKSFTVRTFDEVVAWFSKNWPDGCEWPADMAQPFNHESRTVLLTQGLGASVNALKSLRSGSTADRAAASSPRPTADTEQSPQLAERPDQSGAASRGVSSSSLDPQSAALASAERIS